MSTIEASFNGKIGDFKLDAHFSIPARGVTALFGPSGCGKTSILRCIAGLDRLQNGKLSVDGQIWQDQSKFLASYKRPIGYVFQEASLFPHLSVKENLLYGHKRNKTQKHLFSLDSIAELLGLSELLNRSPQRLSGGERQRVAIGRALMSCPEILLMDEPLAALDGVSKNEILPYLENLSSKLNIPIIYVSHDIHEVERLADHLVFIEKGIVTIAGPLIEILSNPDLPFAMAPEAAAVIEGTVAAYDDQYSLTTLSVEGAEMIIPGHVGQIGAKRRLRVMASDVGLCQGALPENLSFQNVIEARVCDIRRPGEFQTTIFLELGENGGGAQLLAHITKKSFEALNLKKGSKVTTLIKSIALLD